MNTIAVSKKDGSQAISQVSGLEEVCGFIDTADLITLVFLSTLLKIKLDQRKG